MRKRVVGARQGVGRDGRGMDSGKREKETCVVGQRTCEGLRVRGCCEVVGENRKSRLGCEGRKQNSSGFVMGSVEASVSMLKGWDGYYGTLGKFLEIFSLSNV